jgi:hypothetical protein
MTNLPPFGFFPTTGAPLASTIVMIDAPIVATVAILVLAFAGLLCVGAVSARRRRRRVQAARPQVAMPFAMVGGRRS